MANTKSTLAIIAGVSIGAIAGILLAPDSGTGTRKKIINGSAGLANAIKNKIQGLQQDKATAPVEKQDSEVFQSNAAGEHMIREIMHNAKEGIS